jgi:hypothetical protein
MRGLRTSVAAMVAAVSVALSASPASASCAPTPSIEESLRSADLVFVGTVVELNNRNRWATFTLEEVWKGDPRTTRLDVRGAEPGEETTVDRTFEPDMRYLVFARQGELHWEDNACSATREYDPSLDRFKPTSARTVGTTIPASERDDGLKPGSVVFASVVLLLTVGGFIVVRHWGRNSLRS